MFLIYSVLFIHLNWSKNWVLFQFLKRKRVAVSFDLTSIEYPVTYGLLKFIARMCTEQAITVNPSEIRSLVCKHFPYITDGAQHDSNEFFVEFVLLSLCSYYFFKYWRKNRIQI